MKVKLLNHGPCLVCGKDVTGSFPWFSRNADHKPQPLHDECAKAYLFGDDEPQVDTPLVMREEQKQ